MKYILGIDQGGTKTAAAIMDRNGLIVGAAYVEGAYHPHDGLEYALKCMKEAVLEAEKQAGVARTDIELVVAGITGVDWPEDYKFFQKALQQHLEVEKIEVHNDSVIAMYGGTRKTYGMVLCAGTGLNGAILDSSGKTFIFGDYIEENMQGGSALAHRALRKVFDAYLGLCDETELTDLFLAFAKVGTVDELLHKFMTNADFSKQIKLLIPQIMQLAQRGEKVTCALVDSFAEKMCRYVAAGLRKMNMTSENVEIVLAGSVFKGEQNRLTSRLVELLNNSEMNVEVVLAEYEPVVGACIKGLLQDGFLSETIQQTIRKSAQEKSLDITC
ncbi:BadF/BadG/BcrA/BcrD ATPase family protein [Oscillospiraceae bacterium PP1C4]